MSNIPAAVERLQDVIEENATRYEQKILEEATSSSSINPDISLVYEEQLYHEYDDRLGIPRPRMRIFLSNLYAAVDLECLKQHSIDTVINMAGGSGGLLLKEVKQMRLLKKLDEIDASRRKEEERQGHSGGQGEGLVGPPPMPNEVGGEPVSEQSCATTPLAEGLRTAPETAAAAVVSKKNRFENLPELRTPAVSPDQESPLEQSLNPANLSLSLLSAASSGTAASAASAVERLAENYPDAVLENYATNARDYYEKFAGIEAYLEIPARDDRSYDIREDCRKVYQCNKHGLTRNVLVHCVNGINRSCAVVAFYLMWRNDWSVHHTVDHISQRRLSVLTNANFLAQLLALEAECNGTKSADE
eukprot:g16099.t1